MYLARARGLKGAWEARRQGHPDRANRGRHALKVIVKRRAKNKVAREMRRAQRW